jgi:hypothetical protein
MKCFGRSGASKNSPNKFWFWVSHEQKLRRKHTSPNQGIHIQKIAYWYKTYIQRTQKHTTKVFVGCKDQPNNLLITKFPQPTSHTSNTVDKLNKSKSSGLVNIFTLVLPLVRWWWCCCCLFLRQWTMVSLTMVVAVAAVAALRQQQRWRWQQWMTIGGKSGRQQER